MIPNSTLIGAPCPIVLYPVPCKYSEFPVIHPNRYLDLEFSPRQPQHITHSIRKPETFSGFIKETVHLFKCTSAHRSFPFQDLSERKFYADSLVFSFSKNMSSNRNIFHSNPLGLKQRNVSSGSAALLFSSHDLSQLNN